ncbi:50S ribosomal protein L21e [Candidatus Woesearchaeota archaeon]|nr:50S ribosomal protein L21e [Candidatus Woesearchaeota archaeon]
MVQRMGGFRRKTRAKLKKPRREKGKMSQRRFLQKFDAGDRVKLTAEPAYQKGMYFPRFHGMIGVVKGKQGDCYNVEIKDQNKEKVLIVHPVHLRKV